ncbi:MAG TPA: hypothetical protein VFD59_18405 [Nocardioidaceae bacterium]|nr:hypothetical protein [Nocardioidaceae bacterium]
MYENSIRTPSIKVTPELVRTLIDRGGYTNLLFNPTAEQRADGTEAPLPGQGVLLLAGGLVEQSGALEDTIALVELRSVRFLQMVKPGSTLHVELTPGEGKETKSGRVIRDYNWLVLNDTGDRILEAIAVMLMKKERREQG